jgi:raffinose/stachyose/melibiose transport system substrate-binding protein
VFYQNGTWAYDSIKAVGDENLGMLPIYTGVDGEQRTGSVHRLRELLVREQERLRRADIQATLDFMNWCVTSEKGTSAMADDMGFVCPFKSAKETSNPLVKIANDYVANGKVPVDWCFSTMPSETWKNNLGSALKAYAAGTGDWNGVKTAFVNGWASEAKANS